MKNIGLLLIFHIFSCMYTSTHNCNGKFEYRQNKCKIKWSKTNKELLACASNGEEL